MVRCNQLRENGRGPRPLQCAVPAQWVSKRGQGKVLLRDDPDRAIQSHTVFRTLTLNECGHPRSVLKQDLKPICFKF